MIDSRKQIVFLTEGNGQVTIVEVGGKGYSLIQMAEAGPVPPGAVLTTELVAPWLDAIRTSTTWTTFTGANPDAWSKLYVELKRLCSDLAWNAEWRTCFSSALFNHFSLHFV